MVCRCGGIIKVVQNGNWVNISKSRIEANIIDLLRFAENRILKDYNNCSDREPRFSKIKAYNIIHGIILYATGLEKAEPGYIIDEECEKARKPAPHVEITIRPAKEALKQAKYGEVAANAMTMLSGPYEWLGVGLTIVLSLADIIESGEFLTYDNFNSIEAIGNIVYHKIVKSGESLAKTIGKSVSQYSNIATVFTILQDVFYKSYANFVGEIIITVSTYYEEYQFKGNYDILGNRNGEYTPSCKPVQKSIFLQTVPEDNKTTIKYKVYEDGMFQTGEHTDFMW